jgi:mono/diheme cytochrome c family protein
VKPLIHTASPIRRTDLTRLRRFRRPDDRLRAEAAETSEPLWRRHATIATAVTLTIAVAVAACGSAPADTAPATPTGSGAGAELYQSNCASCHGGDLGGTDKGPSHLSIVYEPNHHGDDAFRSAIINGAQQHHWDFGDMAAIPGLDEDEIDDIIGYVRSEQQRQGFEQ